MGKFLNFLNNSSFISDNMIGSFIGQVSLPHKKNIFHVDLLVVSSRLNLFSIIDTTIRMLAMRLICETV